MDKLTGCDQVTWQAWDTLDFYGYRTVTPTENQAINEAYEFLSELVYSEYFDLLDNIEVSAKRADWVNFELFMGKLKEIIIKGV